MGYYYETATTGVPEVDAIGAAVDRAGKSYHHTEQWTEQDANGRCVVDDIDDALRACAATIAALRSQLAAVKIELDNSRYHSHMVTQARIEWEDAAERYERERDEARRERDEANEAMRYFQNAEQVLREGFHRNSLTADAAVVDGLVKQCKELGHRAERAERVVEAADAIFDARDYNEDMVARSDLMVALTEYRALDAAEGAQGAD